MSDVLLPRRGTLVAWTTQGFVPKLPYAGSEKADTFTPFGVGLVQLGDVVRVEARLTENDPAKLRFGMEVELAYRPLLRRRRRQRGPHLRASRPPEKWPSNRGVRR